MCDFAEQTLKAKESIDYSKCTALPGWNIKYKKSGKSVCTLYPFEDHHLAMITFTFPDLEIYNFVQIDFSKETQELIDNTKLFNSTKWIILKIENKNHLQEVINLLKIKFKMYND